MATWNIERAYLVKRLVELKGERTGPLSKGALDKRHEAYTNSLLMASLTR